MKPMNPNRPTKEVRVRTILELMVNNDWHGAKSQLQYMNLWGISRKEISSCSAEANRHLKFMVANDPDLEDRVKVGLEWVLEKATEAYTKYSDRNPMAAVSALRAANESYRVLTSGAESKARIGSQLEPEQFRDLSNEALARLLKKGD
jgi:hypothetical protein